MATAVVAALRLRIGPVATTSPEELLPVLLASALLCVVGLTRRTHTSVAWLATIGAASLATADLARYANEARGYMNEDAWRWMGIATSLGSLLAVGSATAYAASRPRLPGRWLTVDGLAIVLVVGGLAGWAIADPDNPFLVGLTGSSLGALGVVTRLFLLLTLAFTALGVIGDLAAPADRARRRVLLTHRGSPSRSERSRAWLLAFADELAPGRSRARWAAVTERTRIARDIHADVVPGLRQTLADAERGVPADRLAASLREVLADVEAVGATEHPIQLEIGGLVSALEWLAERVQRRSGIEVTLEVAEPPAVDAEEGEPPAEVSSAAFRVAVLALSNVAYHAPGSQTTVRVRSEPRVVELSIVDDGPGISDDARASARARGRRGMADMAAEASACGAVVEVGPGPGEVGTAVTFWWELASTH